MKNKFCAVVSLACFVSLAFLNLDSFADGNDREMTEKIILTTDRSVYIAGEDLFYNLFLMDSDKPAAYNSIGYILIRDYKGRIIGTSQIKISEGKANGAIYLSDTLKTGYYQVVSYTNYMRNAEEANYATKQIIVANRFDTEFSGLLLQNQLGNSNSSITGAPVSSATTMAQLADISEIRALTDQPVYKKRQKVVLTIDAGDMAGKPVNWVISVSEKNNYNEKGNTPVALQTGQAQTNTMVNHSPFYLAEDRYLEFSGRLINTQTGNAIPKGLLYMSSFDSIANFQYATTDSNGYFRFPLSDYYNGKDLFVKVAKPDKSEPFKIQFTPKFYVNAPFVPASFPIDSGLISYLVRSQNIVRVQKSFSQIDSRFESYKYPKYAQKVYFKSNYTISPSDYVELKDFVEIAREILPPYKIRRNDNRYVATMLNMDNRDYTKKEPITFVDGILTDDVNQIIQLGSADIKKIDLVNPDWIFGDIVMPGVLFIKTYKDLGKSLTLGRENYKLTAGNFFKAPNRTGPNYSIIPPGSREPDFRQLLYWNPSLRSKEKSTVVEFYTSDYEGIYDIRVTGMDSDGGLHSAKTLIEVVN